jgi:dolichyl-phosphooligosaccharide-protein glycotransferase
MQQKEIAMRLAIIVIIFSVGFVLRIESTHLSGIPDDEKAFYQDQNGLPYMYELDSYYNYRLTRNYIEHGYLGDIVINGTEWDTHSYYPPGVPMDYPPLIVYLGVLFYKIANLFGNVPLLVTCFWLPAFVGPLSGVVAYLFVRRFTNDYGAAAAGIMAVTAPFYFMRTVPGWYDTDMFNVIFPLLVVWFFVEAVLSKNIRIRMFFTALSAFSMFIYAMAWNGWQYLFYLMVLFSVFYIIGCKLRGEDVKNLICILGTFLALTLILVGVFTGYLNLLKLVLGPSELIALTGNQSPWIPYPDIYSSISELGKPSFIEVISGVGLAFFGGILGLIWILRVLINKKLKKHLLNRMNWFFYLFLVVWIITGFITLTKGSRFIIMLIPPLVVSTGLMVGISIEYLNCFKNMEKLNIFNRRKNLVKILSILVLVLVALPAILNVYGSFSTLTPSADDDLWTASEWINNNTSNDTLIISEWSWGHIYTAIANRPVAFDERLGYIETLPIRNYDDSFVFHKKSPSTSRQYWIDKAFSSSNESLSLGIFRMLATSGDTGYLTLDEYTKNTTKTVEILNNILGVDKQTAFNIMTDQFNLSSQEAQNVLEYTHPSNSRPFIIVTNEEMINKGFWTFYFGGWDLNKNQGENITYSFGKISPTKNGLSTSNGVVMDAETDNITWNGETPYCVIVVTGENVEKRYINENSDFCAVLLMDDKKALIMDKSFENSMFTKMVMERTNTTYFQSIYKNKGVVVWKPVFL